MVFHELAQANRSQPAQRAQKHPITPEAKERSCCNALRHGLTAETVISAREDAEDYQGFEAAVIADHDAETAVERELVLRLASVLWWLRHATGIETALFESVTAEPGQLESGYSSLALVAGTDPSQRDRFRLAATRQSDTAPQSELGIDANSTIADSFLRLAGLPTYPLDRFSRYEYMLGRQAHQIMFMLESLRRRKRVSPRVAFPFSIREI